jgi:redox-sensitive bicupin YhaK (pirin superfamily)
MITLRKSNDRGHARHGWLESYHTFSFANYHDPKYTGFRDLLVINEDRVQPGQGFGTHGHKDMEIISYVLEGELAHKDSMGTGSVIRPGDVQRMSAGTGVRHSEFNHSKDKLVHFLQIWITPKEEGIKPSYEEKKFSSEEKKNNLRLIVSPEGESGSLGINQDARVYATLLDEGKEVSHDLRPGRHGWVQVVRGSVDLNGERMEEGDGASISDERALKLTARTPAEVLLFDLP